MVPRGRRSRVSNAKRHGLQSPALLSRTRWCAWYDKDPRRLRLEQEAMHSRFSGFVLTKGDREQLGWVGTLTSNRGRRYKVLVEYTDEFPHSAPGAYIVEPQIKSQHMYGDSHLCLMYPGEGTWQTNTTCAQIVALVSAWIFAYETHAENCQRSAGGPCLNPRCPDWPGPKK